MPRLSIAGAVLLGWLGTMSILGCGGGSGASGATNLAVPQGFAVDGETVQASVQAPRDAAFTIYCLDFTGPNHAAVAEQVRKQVEEVSGLKDFYLVRGESRTVLYHGFYSTFEASVDRREAQRAQQHRERLESLVDARGAKIFPRTVFEPLERPDPPAPAEWDLRNASGHWTLLVATYTDPVRGKQAAVDSVRDARQQGLEAFYLFKDSQSHVCVGTWPIDAIRRQTSLAEEAERKERTGAVDPLNPPTIVVAVGKLHERWKNMRDQYGRPLELYETRVEIQDPTLRKRYESLAYVVDGQYHGSDYPLLLEIPLATERADAIDSKPIEDKPQMEVDPALLKRF